MEKIMRPMCEDLDVGAEGLGVKTCHYASVIGYEDLVT